MGSQAVWMVASLVLACCAFIQASDPELTTDFAVPLGVNASGLDGSFFTSTAYRNVSATSANFVTITKVNLDNLQALEGLGVSSALLEYPAGAVNPPHTHPRGSELLLVISGVLNVGLIDTTNKLFTQTLQAGDSFVFPIGLVHFQINDGNQTVVAVSAFSSSMPGQARLPNILFKSGSPADALAKSFGVDSSIISQLTAATVE